MEQIPFVNHTIKDKSELFGREGLIKKLVNSVDRRNENVNLVGCRRFGKTCVLEVLTRVIKDSPESRSYPIYIDPKSWNIGYDANGKIGTANVYRYLLAILIESLSRDSLVTEDKVIRDVHIKSSTDKHEFYNALKGCVDSSIADTFADVVRFYSEKIRKTIVFLIDEYEFLMTKAFGESTGFQTLRKLSSEDNSGFRPFSFLVAGAVTWEHLCSTIGSKELNTIGNHIHFIRPLKYEDFSAFWESECEKIEDKDDKLKMLEKKNTVYKLSGGVPFHANDLASSMLSNDGEIPFTNHTVINEILDSLNYRQKETLYNVAIKPEYVQSGADLIYLRSLGLVSADAIKIPIQLLNNWIFAESRYQPNDKGSYIDVKVDAINDLIECINDTVYNKGYIYMFTPQNHDNTLTKKIKTECIDKFGFGVFVDAIWKNHFEKTKDEETQRNKAFLPEAFRDTQFTSIIGTLRHVYSGHLYGPKFNIPAGRLTKEEALYALYGSKNEPYGEQDYLTLQKAILDMYEKELNGILDEVKTWEDAIE